MCEVVKSTFKESFPEIEKAIQQCDFVAVDTEFTGLKINEQVKPSLFDDPAERYKKLRKTITQIAICQIGISTFKKDPDENRYEAKTYNFYLCPRSFGPLDNRFFLQTSSLEFLCRYKFDFNKFIYEGISHMNDEQERLIRDHIASKAMFTGLERDVDEKAIQNVCSRVAEWIVLSDEGEKLEISKQDMEGVKMYVLSTELRGRFPGIWTTILRDTKSIELEKISAEKRQELERAEVTNQKDQEVELIENMLGFTRVFRVMTHCKKPLLGHNMLMDLMLLYDNFHQPLPHTYKEFKAGMHTLFPKVYDTKHLSSTLRKSLEETGLCQITSLGNLYKDLNSDGGRDIIIHPPSVSHAEGFDRYKADELPHEAGYDAYMCGFVFLRLAHVITYRKTKSSEVIPCLFRRYLQTTEPYMNRINVIRATVSHIKLDTPDPESRRPELLFVKSKMFKKKLNIDQLAKWFSPYGSVDVKEFGPSRALVATGNYSCARDILQTFKTNNNIYVVKYSMWKHSPVARGLLWSGVVISSGICMLALLSSSKKT